MSPVHYLRDHQKVTRCRVCRASVIYVLTSRHGGRTEGIAIEYATLQEMKTNKSKFRGFEHVCPASQPKEKEA